MPPSCLARQRAQKAVCALLLAVLACNHSDKHPAPSPFSSTSAVAPARSPAPAESVAFPAPTDVAAPGAGTETTATGVALKLITPGTGSAHPGPNDCVRVNYTIWKRDGALHSSSRSQGQPVAQCLQKSMPGLTEALERMVVGEARRVWIPGRLTYSSREPAARVPQVDLTVDIELVELLKAPPTPPDLEHPPARASRSASGLTMLVLKPGTGTKRPRSGDRMTVNLSGWTAEGRLIESTELSGHPTSVTQTDVVPGLREGLSRLVEGEKARFWLPPALAYGDKPKRGAPAGPLVYDVELLRIE